MKSYLIDMDGVLVSGQSLIPGADEFIQRLKARKHKFVVLTNNPMFTPVDLAHRLQTMGLEIEARQIFTSAIATARFLAAQHPNGKAFVVGETGLTEALHDAGYILTDINPDYVVVGETFNYSFDRVTRAVRLVNEGAHFIATNPDPNGPGEGGLVPACGAMAALIGSASGKMPFFIGKPNPFMMRAAIKHMQEHTDNTIMIGDRMDTDIVAGLQSGLKTILVLSGVTNRNMIASFPYQPDVIVESVADIIPE